ncbi:hypothetical protein GUITHDRAFT_114735 [Guillardia theta CCMP2712]|uniref:Uncharacterized protein n=1 Tax=Guillardia theta (strain CCMP2712) TaxID=905079 RepID=L1IT51_GUITC|nr:hypothetical protein GUITHDRAFT_114735 [Guillardia theta CCMP2712]EKX39079.1 hypothetical protein GUITHDRAFT_114735 [Guillardia theta CCMP2712]|eukprot:XP_005826059.1 hypothetical protein GUITHDRAFT_114735 [Guillardia theta CCMP2712]
MISLKNNSNQEGASKLSPAPQERSGATEEKFLTPGISTYFKDSQLESFQPDVVATDRAVATLGLAMRKLQKELKMLGNELRGSSKSPRTEAQMTMSDTCGPEDCLNLSNSQPCDVSTSSLRVCPGTAKKGEQEWRISSDFTQDLDASVQEDSPSMPCAHDQISESTALQNELNGRTAEVQALSSHLTLVTQAFKRLLASKDEEIANLKGMLQIRKNGNLLPVMHAARDALREKDIQIKDLQQAHLQHISELEKKHFEEIRRLQTGTQPRRSQETQCSLDDGETITSVGRLATVYNSELMRHAQRAEELQRLVDSQRLQLNRMHHVSQESIYAKFTKMTADGSKKEAVDPPGWVTIKAGISETKILGDFSGPKRFST